MNSYPTISSAGALGASSKNLSNPARVPLSVQLVPSTYTSSTFKCGWMARRARTWHPTPMNSNLFTSRASTVESTSRFGDNTGFTPRAATISSTVLATNGRGVKRSSGSDCTHTTASTSPSESMEHAIDVTIPVHCAPGTDGTTRALNRPGDWTTPKMSSSSLAISRLLPCVARSSAAISSPGARNAHASFTWWMNTVSQSPQLLQCALAGYGLPGAMGRAVVRQSPPSFPTL